MKRSILILLVCLLCVGLSTNQSGAAVDDYVWVTSYYDDTVTRIRKSDLSTTTINVGSGPYGVAVDEDWVWVTNLLGNSITRIKKSDLSTTTIGVGNYPEGVAVDEDYVWVTWGGPLGSKVTRIRKSDLSTTTIGVGWWGVSGVAVDQDWVWVMAWYDYVGIRIKKSDLSTTIFDLGIEPYGVAVDQNYVWVASGFRVYRVRKSDLSTTTIDVADYPQGVAVDKDYVWVTSGWVSSNVTRIRKSDLTTTTIDVGSNPCGVSVDQGYVWVANRDDGTITRIDKSDLSTTTIDVGNGPRGFGDMTGYAYDYFFLGPILPDIKANGSDGPLTIPHGANLSVSVILDPGSHGGEAADWWVRAKCPFGLYWYTKERRWVRSDAPIRVYGGPLFNLAPYEILNSAGLPIGIYKFHFGVDLLMNGSLDFSQLYYDTVDVNIEFE